MRRDTAPGVLQRSHQSVSTSRFVSDACSVMSGYLLLFECYKVISGYFQLDDRYPQNLHQVQCYVAKFYSLSKKVSCMQDKVALRSQCNMRTCEKITVDQNLRFQSVTQYLSALQSS